MSTRPARSTAPADGVPGRAASSADPRAVRYAERRAAPWWWWAIAIVLLVPTVEAVTVLGPDMQTRAGWPVAIGSLLASLAVIAAVMLSISRSDVVVDDAGLRAGRQRLPASSIGRVRALDAATAREVLGPAARADAVLSLRPWIRTAVQLEVRSNDAAAGDSAAPYWVVASRHPAELAAALRVQQHGILSGTGMPDDGGSAQPS